MHVNILTSLILIKNTFECVMQRVEKGQEPIKKKGKRRGEVKIQSESQKAPTVWLSQNVMSVVWKTKFIQLFN